MKIFRGSSPECSVLCWWKSFQRMSSVISSLSISRPLQNDWPYAWAHNEFHNEKETYESGLQLAQLWPFVLLWLSLKVLDALPFFSLKVQRSLQNDRSQGNNYETQWRSMKMQRKKRPGRATFSNVDFLSLFKRDSAEFFMVSPGTVIVSECVK